ncbi:MAG: hypothetical protein KGM49_09530 [Sphingomonadales bacterium]|nr:hypothetical protein [Sphingomonadales bacterium]
MTRSFTRPASARNALVVLALGCAVLGGCSGKADGEAANDAASASATSDANAGPLNMATAGPSGNTPSPPKHSSSSASSTQDDSSNADQPPTAQATDENGQPIAPAIPQPSEDEIRRAVEAAENK